VAESKGARFVFNAEVTAIRGTGSSVSSLTVRTGSGVEEVRADAVVANADYPYVENSLLEPEHRSLPVKRWGRRTFAPGVLNFYVGLDKRLPAFAHHTFFFDTDWNDHFDSVYGRRRWPEEPLFYLHIPSITDPNCAPAGHEAVYILVPCAIGLDDTEERRQHYFNATIDRMERLSGESIRDHIVFQESMSLNDFIRDYHAYQGTAFGLGQTLTQTAFFRPANRSKRLGNLYYAGQFTVPGTGTTMSMISGKIAAMRIADEWPLQTTKP